ncbi:DUF421 domain-containing protein [Lederbergia citrea]|uniref:DUF421 domain-containing protein n=1 Tax=Lederbergia citrea TaxID=2833581 RepID=UPI0032119807
MSLFWKVILIALMGIVILKFSGRKSISQMTIPEVVVMLSIGTVLVQPIGQKSVGKTGMVVALFVAVLFLLEYLQLKINWLEKLVTGKSKIVIQNGVLNVPELKKLRLTVDQLEMRLRMAGITKIEDVKTATTNQMVILDTN